MSFAGILDNLALEKSSVVRQFERLIAPKSDAELEALAQKARALTRQNFGRTMRLFAPLYCLTSASTIAVTADFHATTPSFA